MLHNEAHHGNCYLQQDYALWRVLGLSVSLYCLQGCSSSLCLQFFKEHLVTGSGFSKRHLGSQVKDIALELAFSTPRPSFIFFAQVFHTANHKGCSSSLCLQIFKEHLFTGSGFSKRQLGYQVKDIALELTFSTPRLSFMFFAQVFHTKDDE